MRLAVLATPESWYARDLARAVAGEHEIVTLPFSSMTASVGRSCNPSQARAESGALRVACAGHDLADFDAVLVRTMPPGSLEQVVFRMESMLIFG